MGAKMRRLGRSAVSRRAIQFRQMGWPNRKTQVWLKRRVSIPLAPLNHIPVFALRQLNSGVRLDEKPPPSKCPAFLRLRSAGVVFQSASPGPPRAPAISDRWAKRPGPVTAQLHAERPDATGNQAKALQAIGLPNDRIRGPSRGRDRDQLIAGAITSMKASSTTSTSPVGRSARAQCYPYAIRATGLFDGRRLLADPGGLVGR